MKFHSELLVAPVIDFCMHIQTYSGKFISISELQVWFADGANLIANESTRYNSKRIIRLDNSILN